MLQAEEHTIMEFKSLASAISGLLAQNHLKEAEQLLLEAQEKAERENDASALHYIISELIGLYIIGDPPLWTKAEMLSTKRERLAPSAYGKLQTAMILHRGTRDHLRAISKLEEAIILAESENDEKTMYRSLCLLGEASLALDYTEKAKKVLSELERMVARRARIVVGDETPFLEALKQRLIEVNRLRQLASTLASVCRD